MAILTPNKTPVQGVDVVSEISTDNGTTYKKIICVTKKGWQIQNSANVTKTQCGPFVGLGGAEETVPVEGVVNVVTGDDADDYVSYAELKTLAKAGTSIMIRQQTSGGTPYISNTGKAYLTDLNLDIPMDNVCTYSATFKIF